VRTGIQEALGIGMLDTGPGFRDSGAGFTRRCGGQFFNIQFVPPIANSPEKKSGRHVPVAAGLQAAANESAECRRLTDKNISI
jgi:hypothetical protein